MRIFVFLFSIFTSSMALADGRHVLLIANSAYKHVKPLENPSNDTRAIASSFETLGYQVTRLTNLDHSQTRIALRDFQQRTIGAEHAIIYYAGHGIEVDGRNFMVPVDARLQTDLDVELEAIPLDLLSRATSQASSLSLVVLDACRDNPFVAAMSSSLGTRNIGRGLSPIEPSRPNTLIAYAAKAGTLAFDGEGNMSPYATSFNRALQTPGLEISQFFRQVRDGVMDLTSDRQEPFHYGSLSAQQIYFSAPIASDPARLSAHDAKAPAGNSAELLFWETIKDSEDPNDFLDFAAEFSDSVFLPLAERRAAMLLKQPSAAQLPDQGMQPTRSLQEQMAASAAVQDCDKYAGVTDHPDREAGKMLQVGRAFSSVDGARGQRACTAALEEFPNHPRMITFLGRALDSQGKYEEAVQHYKAAAQRGDPTAQNNLGALYTNGLGVEQDDIQAVSWYRKAAEQGNARAQNNLGLMYRNGRGLEQDDIQAVSWYRKAAEQGNASAQTNLGWMYRNGRGVEQDDIQAVSWFRKAAEQGNAISQHSLGWMYEDGRGVAQDYGEAAQLYIQSVSNGRKEVIDLNMHANTVKAIQQELKKRGYYSGAIDGAKGTGTKAAMRRLLP
ncbi:MAG: caspase family protein [Rhodobacteraceae bacterium]|nr:caspase family protein [Paracoccaceae bacterium]